MRRCSSASTLLRRLPVQRAAAHALRANWLSDRGELAEAAAPVPFRDRAGRRGRRRGDGRRRAAATRGSARPQRRLRRRVGAAAAVAALGGRARQRQRAGRRSTRGWRSRSTTPSAVAKRASITCARSSVAPRKANGASMVALLVNLSISWASAGHMRARDRRAARGDAARGRARRGARRGLHAADADVQVAARLAALRGGAALAGAGAVPPTWACSRRCCTATSRAAGSTSASTRARSARSMRQRRRSRRTGCARSRCRCAAG